MAPHAAGLAALLLDPSSSGAGASGRLLLPDLIASSSSSSSTHLSLSLLDAGVLGVDSRLSAVARAVAAAADVLANSTRASADAVSASSTWDWVPGFNSSSSSSSDHGSSGWSGGCPAGFGASMGKLKRYPAVAVPSSWSLLTPQQLLWLFLKNTGIVFLLQVRWVGWCCVRATRAVHADRPPALTPASLALCTSPH
jgi:hypothetical protein